VVSEKVMYGSEYEAEEEEHYELETLTPIRPQFAERFEGVKGMIFVDGEHTHLRKAWRSFCCRRNIG